MKLFKRKPKVLTREQQEEINTKDFFDMILPPTIKFKSDSSTSINEYKINNYKDEDLIITYNNKDISNICKLNNKKCKITYFLKDNKNIEQKYETKTSLENAINKITEPDALINIKYQIMYTNEDDITLNKIINKKVKLK